MGAVRRVDLIRFVVRMRDPHFIKLASSEQHHFPESLPFSFADIPTHTVRALGADRESQAFKRGSLPLHPAYFPKWLLFFP